VNPRMHVHRSCVIFQCCCCCCCRLHWADLWHCAASHP
jgi:hypothetical protein